MMKKYRELVPYGFVAYTGKQWANCQVDSYNAIQDTINSFIQENLPIPEYLINGSHNLFSAFSTDV